MHEGRVTCSPAECTIESTPEVRETRSSQNPSGHNYSSIYLVEAEEGGGNEITVGTQVGAVLTKEPSAIASHTHVYTHGLVLISFPPLRSTTAPGHMVLVGVVIVRVLARQNGGPSGRRWEGLIRGGASKLCTHTYREGQQTGVVTKALLNTVPCSAMRLLTAGCTSREPSLRSWSSVRMYTERVRWEWRERIGGPIVRDRQP